MRKVLYLMGILEDSDIQWIVDNGIKFSFSAEEVLIQHGVPIEYLYILLDGRLSVQLPNGIQVAMLMVGEVIGEISFVDSRPPLASVVAELPSVVLGIEKRLLGAKLTSDGQFGSRFYRAIALFLADRLRSTTGRLGYGSAVHSDEDLDDPDELDGDFMQMISMANTRFEYLMRSVK